jgi:phosphoglycolate phosphatase
MTCKGIIFDLDGTLADTLEDIAGSMNHVLQLHGFPAHAMDDYKLLVGRGLDHLVRQSLPQDYRLPEIVSTCLAEMMADYEVHCLDKTRLYNGIPEMLQDLSGREIKLAVFSNKAEPLTHKIVHHLMGNIPFKRVMGASTGLPKKPDPAGALHISGMLGISPGNMIYMGDSDVDMITATRAGMFAVGVLWGFRSGEELRANGAEVLLSSPAGLLKLLGNHP